MVAVVEPDSPAAEAGVQKHDVLTKLNDQTLVNPLQLQSLVRMQKPGRVVTLSLIREARGVTVEAKLTEKEVVTYDHPWSGLQAPPGCPFGSYGPLVPLPRSLAVRDPKGGIIFTWPPASLEKDLRELPNKIGKNLKSMIDEIDEQGDDLREELQELPEKISRQVAAMVEQIERDTNLEKGLDKLPPGIRGRLKGMIGRGGATIFSQICVSDGEHKLDLTVKNSAKRLKVTDKAGKVIYDGPIETDSQRRGLPPEVRRKLDHLEEHLSIEASGIILD